MHYLTEPEWRKIHEEMKGKALRVLKEMDKQILIKKHPLCRYPYGATFSDRKANDLTKAIVKYIQFRGFQAERINRLPVVRDNRKTYKDVLGITRTIGSVEYRRSGGTDGTADISATIAGRAVKIEVKIGKDRQSDKQRDYQAEVERSGGYYFIAKDFQSTYDWINQLIYELSKPVYA